MRSVVSKYSIVIVLVHATYNFPLAYHPLYGRMSEAKVMPPYFLLRSFHEFHSIGFNFT